MLQVFQRYRAELGVEASPLELQLALSETRQQLGSDSARVSLDDVARTPGGLDAVVAIESLAGHMLPTAYPSRRVWLEFSVRDGEGNTVFSSGALGPTGAISGNDNDADPARYEPHYETITTSDQVQIYESVLADASGEVTTGLLEGVDYMKDNRVLPSGFDKVTAEVDIAVHGRAVSDADFIGGADAIRYSVQLGGAVGPFRVEAVLWHQPVGYRWAENLRSYSAEEPERFVGYYESMAEAPATVLARSWATVE
jgi:hypothetical protein